MNIFCIVLFHRQKKVFTGSIEHHEKENTLRFKGEWDVYKCQRKGCDFERMEPAGKHGPSFDCNLI